MMYKAYVAVYSEICKKCEHHVEFLMFNVVVRKETARL
jgi:hypothetical protein